MTCSVPQCEAPSRKRGWCVKHYNFYYNQAGGLPPLPDHTHRRFWEKVWRGDGCWLWTGAIAADTGYGVFRYGGRNVGAHRASYLINVGPIDDGLVLDHLCHTNDPTCPGGECLHRLCVSPEHLEAVTPFENTRRSGVWELNRKTRCKRGHEFTEESAYINKYGARACRKCANFRRSRRKAAI